jgi:hypothetical protein
VAGGVPAHGLRYPAPIVPGVENKEDWERHRDGVLESISPKVHLELVLAERVCTSRPPRRSKDTACDQAVSQVGRRQTSFRSGCGRRPCPRLSAPDEEVEAEDVQLSEEVPDWAGLEGGMSE